MTASLAGILVTDLVASTSLRARLGDQRAELMRRDHERLLRAVVLRHRGLVVQWLGDGIQAAFPSASAAARAAMGIQQAVDRENRRPRRVAELSVRVGLSAGDVRWSDRGCQGRPEREATALCAASAGGEIRISEDAIDLIGSRESLRTRALGNGAFVVEWQPIRKAKFRPDFSPFPRDRERLSFVGRSRQLGMLAESLRRAVSGDPRLVVIQGDAGIGKSRLCAEFARQAAAQGAVVLIGTSREGLGIPYEPIAGALRSWIEGVEDVSIRLGARSGELARLVPELVELVPDLPPPTRSNAETERICLYDAVGEWLSTAAMDDPVVLVLDSLHFAANSTFDLLHHLIRSLVDSCILLVTTHRPGDPRTEDLQRWAREALGPGAVSLVDLPGLASEDVARLVEQHANSDGAKVLAGAIHLVTGGNPLHIGELLRVDSGELEHASLPGTVEAALRANLDRLDEFVHRVLEIGSVLGEEFDAALLAQVMDDPDRTYDALERLERNGLVRVIDRRALRYAFSHSMTRHVLYEAIGAGRVARIHERAAQLIEARRDERDDRSIPELARHYGAASALGNRDRAARYAVQAADRALRQYANEQAADLFGEAISLIGSGGDPALKCDAMIGRGDALRRMGAPEYRPALAEAADLALQLSDGDRAGRALLATYRGTFSHALQVDRDQIRRLRSSLDRIGGEVSVLRARLLALLAVELTWADDRTESQLLSDEAIDVARETGDGPLLAEVLARRQWTVFHPIEDRLHTAAELALLARSNADPMLRFETSGTEVFTAMRIGKRDDLERAMAEQRALAAEIDQPMTRWMLLINEATLALLEGRFSDMERAIDTNRDLGRVMQQPDVESQYAGHRFWLDFEVMPTSRARISTERLAQRHRILPSFHRVPVVLRCHELGLHDLAETIAAVPGTLELDPLVDQLSLSRACQLAQIAWQCGDSTRGEQILSRLRPHAAEHANMLFGTMGCVSRYVGLLFRLLGNLDEAESALRAAEDANGKLGAVTWLARTRLDLAELRFERSGRSDPQGRELLAQATRAATELGLPVVLDRAIRLTKS